MDQQVEHVVALSTDLQSSLNPVQRRRLEELGRLERSEQISGKKTKYVFYELNHQYKKTSNYKVAL